MVPQGTTPFESAVARAMSERIGMGGATFHVGGAEGPAPSVYLGVFRRDVLAALGGFDEHFIRAQDWELNHRIQARGELVWFDPRLQVGYRPRAGVRALASQFRGSGLWRWQIIDAEWEPLGVDATTLYYPLVATPMMAPTRAYDGVAALTTSAVGLAGAALVANAVLVHSAALSLVAAAVPASYLAVVVAGSLATRRGLDARTSALYPVVLVTMHLSWGLGFLRGAGTDAVRAVTSRFARKPAGTARLAS